MHPTAVEVVMKFWELTGTNDFLAVGSVLGDDFVLDWPQSGERIRGRQNFARMNEGYPAHGRWLFTIHRIIGGQGEAASDVSVTDGAVTARAISFFQVRDGKIYKMVEFWPEKYDPPENRKHLVERLD